MLRTVRRKRRSRRCSAVKWARQTTRLRRCLLPLADQKRLPNIAGQVETRIMTQTINSFHQADHVRPRVASSVEDATPETTHPSAAPETTRPRPPPQHRRPPPAAGCAASPRPSLGNLERIHKTIGTFVTVIGRCSTITYKAGVRRGE